MSKLPVALITNCTASQSQKPSPELIGARLPTDLTTIEACDLWVERVKTYKPSIAPAELYRGVSFYSISKARSIIDPDNIYITSIGQGLVGLLEKIVPYDVSIDPNHNNTLTRVVTSEVFKPAYWWQLINDRLREKPEPITSLSEQADIKLVIVSCTNRFQVLIAEDLLALVQDPNTATKLRIICGSTASLPNHLKPYAIVYDKRMNMQTIGNRNDFNQRAALHFLRMLEKDPALLDLPIGEHRKLVQDELGKVGERTSGGSTSAGFEAVKDLLQSDEALLAMSPDTAYVEVLRQHKITVSTTAFRRAWREVKGLDLSSKKAPPKKVVGAAMKALESLSGKLNRGAGHTSWQDEEDALDALKLFSNLVRESQPDARFGAAEIYSWAQQYYAELEKDPPPQLKSVGKLAHLLRSYADQLGLEAITLGAQQGGSIYKIATTPEDPHP